MKNFRFRTGDIVSFGLYGIGSSSKIVNVGIVTKIDDVSFSEGLKFRYKVKRIGTDYSISLFENSLTLLWSDSAIEDFLS